MFLNHVVCQSLYLTFLHCLLNVIYLYSCLFQFYSFIYQLDPICCHTVYFMGCLNWEENFEKKVKHTVPILGQIWWFSNSVLFLYRCLCISRIKFNVIYYSNLLLNSTLCDKRFMPNLLTRLHCKGCWGKLLTELKWQKFNKIRHFLPPMSHMLSLSYCDPMMSIVSHQSTICLKQHLLLNHLVDSHQTS